MLHQLFIDERGCRPGLGLRIFRGLFFTGFFLAATAVVSVEAFNRHRALGWVKTPCVITHCTVSHYTEDRERPYGLDVTYRYEFGGTTHQGHDGRRGPGIAGATESDAGPVFAHADHYSTGASATCYVNTAKPAEAALEPGDATPFVIAAAVLVVMTALVTRFYSIPQWTGAWFERRAAETFERKRRRERWASAAVLLAGIAYLVPWWGLPIVTTVRARGWPQVPCRIVETGVGSRIEGGEYSFTLHWTDILYTYEYAGGRRFSNAYDPMDLSSMTESGKRSIVERYPVGSTATCRVNPNDPYEAYLSLTPGLTMLSMLLPLGFIVLGAWGLRRNILWPG